MTVRFPHRKRFWLVAYLSVLAGSHVFQVLKPPSPRAAEIDTHTIASRAFPADGEPSAMRNVRLSYSSQGHGFPVVFLHGSPGSRGDFRHLAPMLAEQFQVISVDLPGFGDSQRWVPDYSIRAHARYVLALLDELRVDAAHVVAFSMGSGVTLNMIELAPDRVRSAVFYGGIGIQEGEGSGDYHFEHFKYAVGYALLVVAPELVPHFGLLGPRASRHAFIRNFWDSDQRPLRDTLACMKTPLLILHGRHDPLVPAWTARQHHALVPHSELIMLDASHFMLFSEEGSRELNRWIAPFLERHSDFAEPARRLTLDVMPVDESPDSPIDLELDRLSGPWRQIGAIMLATFVTEDMTCIAVGLLIRRGELDFFVGLVGCIAGIFVGDIGLWLIGRLAGRRVLEWRFIADKIPRSRLDAFGAWLDRRTAAVVLASRFMPGTRMPIYLAAGALGRAHGRFILWLAIGAILWTPILVFGAAIAGPTVMNRFERVFGPGWLAVVAAIVILFILFRLLEAMLTARGRLRLWVGLSRVWRWEFWPTWVFYAPMIPWILWLGLRHRGLRTATAVNPCMPLGGIVGESKHDILQRLPQDAIVPTVLIPPGPLDNRLAAVFEFAFRAAGFSPLREASRISPREVSSEPSSATFSKPLILKPDVGQRGAGVKLVRDESAARAYLENNEGATIAQAFHPGPFEAGVFYCRTPDGDAGWIFSITDKVFPEVTGDGTHTLEQLIWRHPRLRMQAGKFFARHKDSLLRVLEAGERMRLAVAGNHCQGTLFRDGARLITPELEAAFDRIGRSMAGFHFGRFDVRYVSEEQFREGRGFAIIELNGLLSESTNIYDPSWPLRRAYATLMRQWSTAFKIGAAHRRAGVVPAGWGDIFRALAAHLRARKPDPLAD